MSDKAVFKWQSKKQSQSNYRVNHQRKLTTICSQPWTDGIHAVIYLFSQTKEEQKQKQSRHLPRKRDGVTQTKLKRRLHVEGNIFKTSVTVSLLCRLELKTTKSALLGRYFLPSAALLLKQCKISSALHLRDYWVVCREKHTSNSKTIVRTLQGINMILLPDIVHQHKCLCFPGYMVSRQ